jgi:hypothetical protein
MYRRHYLERRAMGSLILAVVLGIAILFFVIAVLFLCAYV